MENLFLSRLSSSKMLVRRVSNWLLCLGEAAVVVVFAWPVRLLGGGTFASEVAEGTCAQPLVFLGAGSWEAMPVKPISPLHRAILQAGGANLAPGKLAELKGSSEYGRLSLSLRPQDKARPLLETAARQGFGDLPVSYLR